ncbi:MAG: CRTAC1 family protein, partial [Pseudomonadota bacterium]
AGMGIAVGDFASNGRDDLVVTHLDFETNTFYRNLDDGLFEDATIFSGIAGPSRTLVGFGINSLDADNDGDLDLFVANGHVLDNIQDTNPSLRHAQPDQLLLNQGNARFSLLQAGEAGDWFGRPTVSRGSAVIDFDNDGALDLLISENNGPAALLRNQQAAGQSWIGFVLKSHHGGRMAIGARLTLTTSNGQTQQRDLRAGSSYMISEDPRLHFGLAPDKTIIGISVRWPEGEIESIDVESLEGGRWNIIEQTDSATGS